MCMCLLWQGLSDKQLISGGLRCVQEGKVKDSSRCDNICSTHHDAIDAYFLDRQATDAEEGNIEVVKQDFSTRTSLPVV